MKKFTSLLLAVIMLSSCFTFVGCIFEDRLGYFREKRIKEDYVNFFNITDKSADDVVLDYYAGKHNGYEIVMLDAEWHDPEKWVEQLGSYSITYYDSNRLYAYKNGVFFTLSEAYNNGYIDNIKEISISWQNDIGGYKDTCDKYDFDKWTSNPTYDELEYKALLISIDKRISGTIPEKIEYLGSNFIKEMYIEFPDADIRGDYAVYVAVLTIPTKIWAEYAMKEISKIPGVLLVEHYHIRSMAASFANDTYYNHNGSWWINNIEIEKVWRFTVGSADIRVGVLDMGISSHSDLISNIVDGYDFFNHDYITNDDIEGHGTFISGIIGAKGDNNSGICGTNWNVSLVPLQADNENDDGIFVEGKIPDNQVDIVAVEEAMGWVVSTYNTVPIDIVNFSIRTGHREDLRTAINNYNGLLYVPLEIMQLI